MSDPATGRTGEDGRAPGAARAFDPKTLPEIGDWANGFVPPTDVDGYVSQKVSIAQAVAVMSLFVPKFTRVGDCVLLANRYSDESFAQWTAELDGDSRRIEEVMNHVHVWDYFQPTDEREEQALEAMAAAMAAGWRASAEDEFPDREFHVRVADDYGPTVIMHSTRRR